MCSSTLLGALSRKATRDEISLPEITDCGCHLEETSLKGLRHLQAITQSTVGNRRSGPGSLNVQNVAPACFSSRGRFIDPDIQADRNPDISNDISEISQALLGPVEDNGLPSEIARAADFFKSLEEICGGPEYHSRLVTLSKKIQHEQNAVSEETVMEDDVDGFGHAEFQIYEATSIRYKAKGKAKLITFCKT